MNVIWLVEPQVPLEPPVSMSELPRLSLNKKSRCFKPSGSSGSRLSKRIECSFTYDVAFLPDLSQIVPGVAQPRDSFMSSVTQRLPVTNLLAACTFPTNGDHFESYELGTEHVTVTRASET